MADSLRATAADQCGPGAAFHQTVARAFPGLTVLALLAAALCALLTSGLYVAKVLQREAAAESAFVNAAVRRSGLASVFQGRREDGAQARLLAALHRPAVRAARVISITGEVVAGDDAPAGSKLDEAAVARALRGEALALSGAWCWAMPIPLASAVEDGSRSLAFVVPVFSESGRSVIGAVASWRVPGPALAAASDVVAMTWIAYLNTTAVLCAVLAAILRGGGPRGWWPRVWHQRTDPREPWRDVVSDLRARTRRRGIVVRAGVDPVLPRLAVDAGFLGVVLRLFAAHALESAAAGDLLLLHVRTLARGVEFAYSIHGATRPDFGADARSSHATAPLMRAVHDAGGALAILNETDRGLRVVVTLPR